MCENCNNQVQEINTLKRSLSQSESLADHLRSTNWQLTESNSRLLKQIDQGVRHIANLEEELRIYKNKPKPKLSEVIREWTR